MKVHRLAGPPSPVLARALAEFEAPFTYPLGPGKLFRISHGDDYTLFFRAQGQGACFIAEDQGRVAGTLGTAIRRVWMPNGTECSVAYFGDLKIAAADRGGLVLGRLARAAQTWLRPKVAAGFSVVMGGTTLTPEAYTGRAGIPDFQHLGRLAILRISSRDGQEADAGEFVIHPEEGLACYRRLSVGRYACPTGAGEQRSQITPVWLKNAQSSACGLLEDTRKAKRLIGDDSRELLSAHLSCFAYNSISAGAELVGVAVREARRLGLPALFLSVVESEAPALRASLPDFEVLEAPAVVYGTGLMAAPWNINSSEI